MAPQQHEPVSGRPWQRLHLPVRRNEPIAANGGTHFQQTVPGRSVLDLLEPARLDLPASKRACHVRGRHPGKRQKAKSVFAIE